MCHSRCVLMSLGWLVVKHNCVSIGVFIDCVEQLHGSAFIGHRQVVLREIYKLNYIVLKHLFVHCALRYVEISTLPGFLNTLLGLLMLLIRVINDC